MIIEIDNLLDTINNSFINLTDNFYLESKILNTLKNQEINEDLVQKHFKLVTDKKHKHDTKLNQLKNSLGLERKNDIDLKTHISNFIRYNYLFDDESAKESIIIKDDPLIMTLDQSIHGTTPVVFTEAVARFYNEFKNKFISHEIYQKEIDRLNRQIELLIKKSTIPVGPPGRKRYSRIKR